MAQLKDTTIDGTLETASHIILGHNLYGIHPTTSENHQILSLSSSGNTVLGYDGYANQNGSTNIYGNDINHYVASAATNYRPYRKAGDTMNFTLHTAGFVTNSGKDVYFVVPLAIPIIGGVTCSAASQDGFSLRQNNAYTHGSSSGTWVNPDSYYVTYIWNVGFVVRGRFSNTTNVVNNAPIGVHWDGSITLS